MGQNNQSLNGLIKTVRADYRRWRWMRVFTAMAVLAMAVGAWLAIDAKWINVVMFPFNLYMMLWNGKSCVYCGRRTAKLKQLLEVLKYVDEAPADGAQAHMYIGYAEVIIQALNHETISVIAHRSPGALRQDRLAATVE